MATVSAVPPARLQALSLPVLIGCAWSWLAPSWPAVVDGRSLAGPPRRRAPGRGEVWRWCHSRRVGQRARGRGVPGGTRLLLAVGCWWDSTGSPSSRLLRSRVWKETTTCPDPASRACLAHRRLANRQAHSAGLAQLLPVLGAGHHGHRRGGHSARSWLSALPGLARGARRLTAACLRGGHRGRPVTSGLGDAR